MGVASPFQSRKPLEYWLDGLKAAELVQLWEFLSRNLDTDAKRQVTRQGAAGQPLTISTPGNLAENLPTGSEVRKQLYNESMPSLFYACKDRGGLRHSDRGKPGL